MRRIAVLALLALAVALPAAASDEKKGQFDLFMNGINKGYEKFKIKTDAKQNLWTITSEVRFKLPWPKAKRNYVDLYVYPVLDLALDSRTFQGYAYRLTYNDFSKTDLVEAKNSATEVIDQDFRNYDLQNRGSQIQDDEMADRIDLGVNAGECSQLGATLHFKQTRFSDTRVKDEPLPKDLAILDAYTFALYIPLAARAAAMKSDVDTFSVALPQSMKLKAGKIVYMGAEKTPFEGKQYILKHFDVFVGDAPFSSFWIDKENNLVQVVMPAEGILASMAKYEPKPFEREETRLPKATVDVRASFTERNVQVNSGGISLAATLTLPTGSGPFPAVLLVQDLSPQDRDGNEPSNPYSRAGTWKQLAYCFAAAGFTTLRFDPRGTGDSGGSLEKALPSERVQDASALAAWLAEQPTTKDKKVLIAASGLGAWVAARVAAKDGAAGLLTYSYPAKNVWRLWKEQVSAMGDPQARQQAYVDLDSLADRLKTNTTEEWSTFRGQKLYLPALKELASWDPLAMAGSVQCPCLFVYPDKDQTVMGFHKDVLAPGLHAGQETLTLEGVGHKLTPVDGEGNPSGLLDCKVLDPIFDWLRKTAGVGKKP